MTAQAFFAGGGKVAEIIEKFDWSQTPLGPISIWHGTIKATVGLILRSPVPIVTLWGEQGTMIYNDAYSGFAGGRHPALLGSPVREGWPEVADFNDHVMKTGLGSGTLSYRDQRLALAIRVRGRMRRPCNAPPSPSSRPRGSEKEPGWGFDGVWPGATGGALILKSRPGEGTKAEI